MGIIIDILLICVVLFFVIRLTLCKTIKAVIKSCCVILAVVVALFVAPLFKDITGMIFAPAIKDECAKSIAYIVDSPYLDNSVDTMVSIDANAIISADAIKLQELCNNYNLTIADVEKYYKQISSDVTVSENLKSVMIMEMLCKGVTDNIGYVINLAVLSFAFFFIFSIIASQTVAIKFNKAGLKRIVVINILLGLVVGVGVAVFVVANCLNAVAPYNIGVFKFIDYKNIIDSSAIMNWLQEILIIIKN